MKILNVVESAYRATLEEQDDTILWMSTALVGAGADADVLLVDNAVNYAIDGQDASGLSIGGREQTQPPRLAQDLQRLMGKGATVFLVKDDAAERGLEGTDFIDGVKAVGRADLAELYDGYDQIWRW